MSDTLICAGGSSLRVLEAALHLCAAGLGPPKLKVMVIDPDKANGNFTRHQGRFDKYSATKRDVCHLFFTADELKEKLGQGFRGHPAIGAAALSLVSLYAKNPPWAQLVAKMRNELGGKDGCRVFLVGSVFGGTGASAIHPVARFLRSIPEGAAVERLKIGVAAMVPYFQFVPAPAAPGVPVVDDGHKLAAKSEWFALATRAAAEFYQHLRENDDWPFDSVYWIGDSGAMEVPYHPGGPAQKNPGHFVDLLGALACLEFFSFPDEWFGKAAGCSCAGPRQDVVPPSRGKNLLDWLDVPLLHFKRRDLFDSLVGFFLAGAVHLGFGMPLMTHEKGEIDRRPYCVPWYLERFLRGASIRSGDELGKLELLSQFFRTYHFPWWAQVLGPQRVSEVRLFNRFVLRPGEADTVDVDLDHLANILWPNLGDAAKKDPFDDFFTDMVRVPKRKAGQEGVPNYLSLLARAARLYTQREYHNETPED